MSGFAGLFFSAVSSFFLQISEPQVLFDSSEATCENQLMPDAPSRLFRRADHQIVMVTTYIDNWSMRGSSFEGLAASCNLILPFSEYKDVVRGRLWIEALYTEDGTLVRGIASESLRAYAEENGCAPEGKRGKCWVNQLRAVTSYDGGETFRIGDRLASFGEAYPSGEDQRYGVFTSSNIVKMDDSWYTIAYVKAGRQQPAGNCLLRSDNLADERAWRIWGGAGFTIDPITFERPCATFYKSSPIRSISYVSDKKLWVAVVADTAKLSGEAKASSGFFYITSPDLKSWSDPVRIMDALLRPRIDSYDEVWSYPSLFDPNSKSRNFETIDNKNVVITFTARRLRKGMGTMDRDIKFVRLSIH